MKRGLAAWHRRVGRPGRPFSEREAGGLDLDAERDYERRLTLRLGASLGSFLRAGPAIGPL